MISPWNSGWLKPSTISWTGPIATDITSLSPSVDGLRETSTLVRGDAPRCPGVSQPPGVGGKRGRTTLAFVPAVRCACTASFRRWARAAGGVGGLLSVILGTASAAQNVGVIEALGQASDNAPDVVRGHAIADLARFGVGVGVGPDHGSDALGVRRSRLLAGGGDVRAENAGGPHRCDFDVAEPRVLGGNRAPSDRRARIRAGTGSRRSLWSEVGPDRDRALPPDCRRAARRRRSCA